MKCFKLHISVHLKLRHNRGQQQSISGTCISLLWFTTKSKDIWLMFVERTVESSWTEAAKSVRHMTGARRVTGSAAYRAHNGSELHVARILCVPLRTSFTYPSLHQRKINSIIARPRKLQRGSEWTDRNVTSVCCGSLPPARYEDKPSRYKLSDPRNSDH
jgi:hypothetical protein